MPTKPSKEIIDACKSKLDPRDVISVVINETPELSQAIRESGIFDQEEEE